MSLRKSYLWILIVTLLGALFGAGTALVEWAFDITVPGFVSWVVIIGIIMISHLIPSIKKRIY